MWKKKRQRKNHNINSVKCLQQQKLQTNENKINTKWMLREGEIARSDSAITFIGDREIRCIFTNKKHMSFRIDGSLSNKLNEWREEGALMFSSVSIHGRLKSQFDIRINKQMDYWK